MPLKRCSSDGKSGWKWGDSGHCYTGTDAKRNALKQGYAIDKKRFKEEVKSDISSGIISIEEFSEFGVSVKMDLLEIGSVIL